MALYDKTLEWVVIGLHGVIPLVSFLYLRALAKREPRYEPFPIVTGVLGALGILQFFSAMFLGWGLTFLVYAFLLPAPVCALGVWLFRQFRSVKREQS